MAVERIDYNEELRSGTDKINQSIDQSNEAITKATNADNKSTQALSDSASTQTQLDEIVINGDSSVEAAQARVDERGTAFTTLKDRIDSLDVDLAGRGVNVEWFGALGGTNTDTTAVQDAINYAIANGLNKIYIPFSQITTGSIDCKNLIVAGNNTTITGVLKNTLRFENCKINSIDYENVTLMDSPIGLSVSPKVVEKRTADSYYVLSKRPGGDDYLLFLLERGIVTTTSSVGGASELMRPTSVYNIDEAMVYKHSKGTSVGTWGEWGYSLKSGATTYRDLLFWRNSSANSADYIEFSVTVPKSGEVSLLFYSSGASDPAAQVLADGEQIGTVRLNNFSSDVILRKFTAPPGQRTIRIKTSGNYWVYVAGVNCYFAKDAPTSLVYDKMAFWGGGAPYINNKGAMEYAFYDTDLSLYYGSYHGGETLISDQLMLDNKNASMATGEVRVRKSFAIRQTTNINNKFTSDTYYQISGDGLMEFTASLSGDANLSTAYSCMSTTNNAFTEVIYPKRMSITTDGEYYLGRINKVVQQDPSTGQKITTFLTLFKDDNNALGGVFIRRTTGAYNKVYYGSVVQSLKKVTELSFQTKWLFE
jgi:hypothetical protein